MLLSHDCGSFEGSRRSRDTDNGHAVKVTNSAVDGVVYSTGARHRALGQNDYFGRL